MPPRIPWVVLLGFSSLAAPARSATFHVPGDYATIQAAINAAANYGDQILVGPGTYDENLNAEWKSVSLIGTAGADATIVDGGRRGSVLRLGGGTVEGLTFRNGHSPQGAGLHLRGVYPTAIRNCVIRDNDASMIGCLDPCGEGGGILVSGGGGEQVLVEDCVIRNNHSDNMGSAICCETGTREEGEFRGNLITENSTYFRGPVFLYGGTLVGNRIVANEIGHEAAVDLYYASCNGNTIAANTGSEYGAALRINAGSTAARNIVAGNSGQGIVCAGGEPPECSDSWNNAGGDYAAASGYVRCDTTGRHDFSADPLFCNATDYTISGGSPCYEFGICETIGATPAEDCGPTAARGTTWGALKSLYR